MLYIHTEVLKIYFSFLSQMFIIAQNDQSDVACEKCVTKNTMNERLNERTNECVGDVSLMNFSGIYCFLIFL